ncbi:PREDICTED: cyclic AMP-dependent transcription factor ATF-5, partial [Galeopterus variegatus]|uniref:Cyclic AMP-dependent transcription factor ATF-5 n=1 Tax=Galeopterus variegatus TaxID=482537 RepID=A0ABM0Q5L8_GALVR
MSLLATLGLELDKALLPASGLGWLVDYGKLPLAPAPLGPYEVLGGALEGGLPGGGEPLAGDGFSDWMTERVDFTALLPLEPPLPPGALPLPSPPPPDLEAMASLLKKELEQIEDFFLDAPVFPSPSPPPP